MGQIKKEGSSWYFVAGLGKDPITGKKENEKSKEVSKDVRYFMAFYIAITTGMRQGEILGLRWQDFKSQKSILTYKANSET